MTRSERTFIECDICAEEFSEDSNYTRECKICTQDICEDCMQDHAQEECY